MPSNFKIVLHFNPLCVCPLERHTVNDDVAGELDFLFRLLLLLLLGTGLINRGLRIVNSRTIRVAQNTVQNTV